MGPQKIIKPDILIPYNIEENLHLPIVIIYVRPETNNLHYEKAILEGIKKFANVVYMANLNGKLFIKDGLIQKHYSSQYLFATESKKQMSLYPDMIQKVEEYFNIDFHTANIIGSFEALKKLNINEEELFHVFVDAKDHLKIYGQTIKKIKDYFVLNYDIPALIKRCNPNMNVFVIAIHIKDIKYNFQDINYSIFYQMRRSQNTPLVGEELFKNHTWYEKMRRSYHISRNHIMAMFDMVDFIYLGKNKHLSFHQTPLGKLLVDRKIVKEQELNSIKANPLIYLNKNQQKTLINVIEEVGTMNINSSIDVFKNWIR